jgi:hypothetical protein
MKALLVGRDEKIIFFAKKSLDCQPNQRSTSKHVDNHNSSKSTGWLKPLHRHQGMDPMDRTAAKNPGQNRAF